MEGGVEPRRKNSFDVIVVALDGLFAAVLADQMRIEVTRPGLPESDARNRPAKLPSPERDALLRLVYRPSGVVRG